MISKAPEKTSFTDDKYRDRNVRFYDKDDHYELIFADDFNIPTSGKMCSGDVPESGLVDILVDLKNADKSKELHIFVGSYGGYVTCLNMMLQCIMDFPYRVGINMGMADSCGFMLLCTCNEIYTSPWCQFMYHEMSGINWGKVQENKNRCAYHEKWWEQLKKCTYIDMILTPEELELGKTSEVYLTGKDLIDRKTNVMSYDMYTSRCTLSKAHDFFIVKDQVYRRVGNIYKRYVEEKPCKKNNENCYSHGMLTLCANAKQDKVEFVEQK